VRRRNQRQRAIRDVMAAAFKGVTKSADPLDEIKARRDRKRLS
jgi:hypothetical protein